VSDAGAITQLETRRSGGVAYALTDSTGSFAIGYQLPEQMAGESWPTWLVALITGASVAAFMLLVFLLMRLHSRRSSQRERTRIPFGMPDQNLATRPGMVYPDVPPYEPGEANQANANWPPPPASP
jgi:hypothetical protein